MIYSQEMRPKNLDITVRKVDYDYYRPIKRNRYWANNDPILTHFFNAFQATFPEGEKFFIQAIRDGKAILQKHGTIDHQFETDLQRFIQQEALHSLQHKKWTNALIRHGYTKLTTYNTQLMRFRIFARKYFPASLRLAFTAAAEHYTASMAFLFTHIKPEILRHSPSQFRGLLLYHAMEEIEHKSVSYDLYQNVSGSYLLRILGFVFVTLDLILSVYLRLRYLLNKDGRLNLPHRSKLYKFIFGAKGLVKGLFHHIKRYLHPRFHPWTTDERKYINKRFHKLQSELKICPFKE